MNRRTCSWRHLTNWEECSPRLWGNKASPLGGLEPISANLKTTSGLPVIWKQGMTSHKPTYGDQQVCAYAIVGPNAKVSSYLAGAASSDNTLPRYNVNTFLNSATTRTFPLGSASP